MKRIPAALWKDHSKQVLLVGNRDVVDVPDFDGTMIDDVDATRWI